MATQKPTPENTPLPGGGSYRWSESLPGWVEYCDGMPVATPATQQTTNAPTLE